VDQGFCRHSLYSDIKTQRIYRVMKHTRRHARHPRRGGKSRRSHVKHARRLRGGNDERSAAEIAEQFGLVKRTYGDIATSIDDEYMDIKDYMDDCCHFKGTLPKDSFFVGESSDGTTIVLVGKSASKELIRELKKLRQPLKLYVAVKELVFTLTDSWDHAADTGTTISRSFSVTSKSQIDHIVYHVTFELEGTHTEEHHYSGSRRGSWDVGAGKVIYNPEWEGDYERRMEKVAPAASEALRQKGLVDDVIGIIEQNVKKGYGRPERFPPVKISHSVLYMPEGELGEHLKMNEKTQDVIDEAKERYEEDEPKRKREAEYWESMGPGMYDAPDSPDRGYGYGGYDDEYYGGRRRRRNMTRGRGSDRRHKASRAVTKRKARR